MTRSTKIGRFTFGVIAAAAAVPVTTSSAAVVTYGGEYLDQGVGFGAVLNTLAIQKKDIESGSVLWDGTDDFRTGNAKPFSQTRTVEEILAAGVNAEAFGVVLNINEPGNAIDITVQEFTVVFQDSGGNTLFEAVFDQDMVLEQVGGGTGGAGHLFNIEMTDPEFAQFFGDPTNRLGIIVPEDNPLLNTFGGPENFYIVPAPATAALVGAGALVAIRRRR